jgi:hypothetical protein
MPSSFNLYNTPWGRIVTESSKNHARLLSRASRVPVKAFFEGKK